MGLDILALSNLQYIGEHVDDHAEGGFCNQEGHYQVSEDDFLRHQDLREGACYATTPTTEVVAFRTGSYSGYSWFRNALAHFAHGVPAMTIWEQPEKYQGLPFYELIDFSDSDGTFGPAVCAKLAKDFADHEEQAKAFVDKIKAYKPTGALHEPVLDFSYWDDKAKFWLGNYQNFKDAFAVGAKGAWCSFLESE